MSDSISASFKLLHQYIRHVPGEKSESAAKEIEKVFSYGVPVLSGTFEKSASPLLSCKEDALSHGCAETEGVLQQIEKVFDILPWEYTYKQTLDDPGAGSGIGWAELIGPKAPYRSGDYCLGFTLIAPDTYYPPHHHPQPEIYYYKTNPENGFAYAETGDTVHKVHNNDTVFISPGDTHPQCTPPGYALWYLWAIRHLEGNPYGTPTFVPEYLWVQEKNAVYWGDDQ